MRFLVQLGANANEAKVFKAHVAPLGLCCAEAAGKPAERWD